MLTFLDIAIDILPTTNNSTHTNSSYDRTFQILETQRHVIHIYIYIYVYYVTSNCLHSLNVTFKISKLIHSTNRENISRWALLFCQFPILVKYIDNKSQVIKWWELKFTLLNYWWWDKQWLSVLSSWTLILISNKFIDIIYGVIFRAEEEKTYITTYENCGSTFNIKDAINFVK